MMEPQSLFRKSLLTSALRILQKPATKKKIYEYIKDSNEKFEKQIRKVQTIATVELRGHGFPYSIQKELMWVFEPLGNQIISQTMIYKELGCFHDKIIDDLVWDSNGTINNLETSKNFFERDMDDDLKIRLACVYCPEDKLEDLLLTKDGYWKRQMEDILLYNKPNYYNTLIRYWFERLRKKISKKGINIAVKDREAARNFISSCNELALQYLFKRLTPEDKDCIKNGCVSDTFKSLQSVWRRSSKVKRNEILFYLVKQEDLIELCRRKPRTHLTETIPECFLSFSYRNYFFLYGEVLLQFIASEERFCNLLVELSYNYHLDPELYEVIYSKIWNEYCSKYEYINFLSFNDKKGRALVRNFLKRGKCDFILSIIKRLRYDDKRLFFAKYAEVLMDSNYYKEDILKKIAASCLLNKNEVIEFRDKWNESFLKNKEELSECDKSKDEDYNQRIKCQMLEIIDYLLESFDGRPNEIEAEKVEEENLFGTEP